MEGRPGGQKLRFQLIAFLLRLALDELATSKTGAPNRREFQTINTVLDSIRQIKLSGHSSAAQIGQLSAV